MHLHEELARWMEDPSTLYLVCLSGGKDSVATLLYLLEKGIPTRQIELHHHAVDGQGPSLWDWPCTPSYCQALADAFCIPLIISYRKGGIHREIMRCQEGLQPVVIQDGDCTHCLSSQPGSTTKRRFPARTASLRTRWCSSVVKIDVFARVLTHTARYLGKKLVVCTGERREESANRSRYQAVEWHRSSSSRRSVLHFRPVLDWSERAVWELLKHYRLQCHPAYELGFSRCSCLICIFSSPNTWASIAQLAPERIAYLAALEKELRFTLYNQKSIQQVVEQGISFLRQPPLDLWKAEALSEFISPIFVRHWHLPQGALSAERAGAI